MRLPSTRSSAAKPPLAFAALRKLGVCWVTIATSLALTTAYPAQAQSRPAEPATAEQEQAVKRLVAKGATAYRKGDFKAAHGAFAEAFARYPYASVALSLAEVEMKLGRYLEAARHWEYYLAGDPPDPKEAEAQLAECRKHLGSLRLDVEPRDAEVTVDGVPLDPLPLPRLLWLEPGQHIISGQHAGHRSESEAVEVLAGVEHLLTLRVVAPPAAVAVPAAERPRVATAPMAPVPVPSSGPSSRTVVVVGGAVLTAGALTVAIVSGLHAQAADRHRLALLADLRRAEPDYTPQNGLCWAGRTDRPELCTDLESEGETQRSSVKRANAFYLTGGILGAVTLATFLLWPTSRTPAPQTSLTLSPLQITGSHGVQLGAAF